MSASSRARRERRESAPPRPDAPALAGSAPPASASPASAAPANAAPADALPASASPAATAPAAGAPAAPERRSLPSPRAAGPAAAAVCLAGLALFLGLGAAVGWPGGVDAGARPLGPLGIDRWGAQLADALHHPGAIAVVRILTDLGSLPITGFVVLATAMSLRRTRRAGEGLALAAGLALAYPLVHLAKAAWARPRPLDPHKVADGFAYPSGHAAYAVAFVACALVLGRGRSRAQRAALLAGGVALAVGVAASRVYLRAHYVSDVLGGTGLAAGTFALAWGVWSVRHNRAGAAG